MDKALDNDLEALRASVGTDPADRTRVPVTRGLMRVMGQAIAAIGRAASRGDAQLAERVRNLEQRLATLEAQPLRYEGVHEPGKQYAPGAFVTSGGSIWHCNEPTTSRPGDGGAWTLAVKHGRDLR